MLLGKPISGIYLLCAPDGQPRGYRVTDKHENSRVINFHYFA
jgi:hypothetical protein